MHLKQPGSFKNANGKHFTKEATHNTMKAVHYHHQLNKYEFRLQWQLVQLKLKIGGGEISQQLRVLTVPAEDLGSVPNTHTHL